MSRPHPNSSLVLRLGLVFGGACAAALAAWWRAGVSSRFVYSAARGTAVVLEGSFLSRVVIPYHLPPADGASLKSPSSSQPPAGSPLRSAWIRWVQSCASFLAERLRPSFVAAIWRAATQDAAQAPLASLSAAVFGFITLFFALNFFSGELRGLSMSISALALFLLSLAGMLLPAGVWRGSLWQRLFSRPFQESQHSFLYIALGGWLGLSSFFWGPIPVLGLTAVVAFALWTLAEPEAGLYAVAAYALLDYGIRGSLPPLFGKIWSFALLGLILLAILLRLARDPQRRFYFTWVSLALLLLFLWTTLSLFFNPVSFSVGFEGLRAILQTSLFFLATLNAIRSQESLRRLMVVLAIVLIAISLFGIYQYVTQVPVKAGWVDRDFEQDISSRAFSIFSSPNALSGYLVLFIPLFLVLFLDERKWPAKLLFFLAFALALLAIFFTLTRGAWLALGIALLFLGIFHDRRVLAVLLIAALLLPLLPQFATRFSSLVSGEYWSKSASTGRLYRWDIALEIAASNPLWGSGPGTFGGAVAYRAGYWPGVYADNYYLKTLAETGYGGLGLFLLLLLSILWEGIRRTRVLVERSQINLAWAIQAGLIGFIVHMFTENLWEEPSLAVSFWFLTGLLLALPLLAKGREEALPQPVLQRRESDHA